MTSCVVGKWISELDAEDYQELGLAIGRISRADLYGFICAAEARRPFGLTALKDHLNGKCICGQSS